MTHRSSSLVGCIVASSHKVKCWRQWCTFNLHTIWTLTIWHSICNLESELNLQNACWVTFNLQTWIWTESEGWEWLRLAPSAVQIHSRFVFRFVFADWMYENGSIWTESAPNLRAPILSGSSDWVCRLKFALYFYNDQLIFESEPILHRIWTQSEEYNQSATFNLKRLSIQSAISSQNITYRLSRSGHLSNFALNALYSQNEW